MIAKDVSQIGSLAIRSKAKPVSSIRSLATKHVLRDLVDSMRHYNLVGMAAPQIGKSLRIFVTEVRPTKFRKKMRVADPLRVFINPKIIRRSTKTATAFEGCGSVANAGIFGPVKRSVRVLVQAYGVDGKSFELNARGFLARIIQHEYDHLEGVVILDKFVDTKKVLDRSEYLKKCSN